MKFPFFEPKGHFFLALGYSVRGYYVYGDAMSRGRFVRQLGHDSSTVAM